MFFIDSETCLFFPTAIGGEDEAKLIGGFQDVATLLNCLTGQSSGDSKQHKPEEPPSTLTSFDLSNSKADGGPTSPSKAQKNRTDKDNIVPANTDYDTGIHSSLVYRKCNSLPRARATKIFINNLHNLRKSPEKSTNLRVKYCVTPFVGYSTVTEGCKMEHMSCNLNLLSSSGGGDLSLVPTNTVSLVCSTDINKYPHCQHGGAPKKSKSFSTVSYIATSSGGCLCTITQSQPELQCIVSSSKSKNCATLELHSPLTSRCSKNAIATPFVNTKSSKTCSSGELSLL